VLRLSTITSSYPKLELKKVKVRFLALSERESHPLCSHRLISTRESSGILFAGHYNYLIIPVNYYTTYELTFAQFAEIQFEINVQVKPFK